MCKIFLNKATTISLMPDYCLKVIMHPDRPATGQFEESFPWFSSDTWCPVGIQFPRWEGCMQKLAATPRHQSFTIMQSSKLKFNGEHKHSYCSTFSVRHICTFTLLLCLASRPVCIRRTVRHSLRIFRAVKFSFRQYSLTSCSRLIIQCFVQQIQNFILQSILRHDHTLFRNKFPRYCILLLPLKRTALLWVITQRVVVNSNRRLGKKCRSLPQGSRIQNKTCSLVQCLYREDCGHSALFLIVVIPLCYSRYLFYIEFSQQNTKRLCLQRHVSTQGSQLQAMLGPYVYKVNIWS